jgi:hypothetical protein
MSTEMKARVETFSGPYVRLERVSESGGNVEMAFAVTGTYSFSTPDTIPVPSGADQVKCAILFDRPLPRDPR